MIFSLRKYLRESFGRNLLNEEIKKHAPGLTGNILDVGSGSRRYDSLFHGAITAIDIREDNKRGIGFGDIHAIPYKDETFDAVLCFEVLCYSPDVPTALRELIRVVKPGGRILLTMPFLVRDCGDRIRFTRRYAEELLVDLKIDSFEITAVGNAWTIIWDVMRTGIFKRRSRTYRGILYLLFFPYLLFILSFHLHKAKTPLYVTGFFVSIKK